MTEPLRILPAMFQRALDRAGIPVVSVSMARWLDRATWQIIYAPSATEAQRTAGEALKLSYQPDTDSAWTDEQAILAVDQADKIVRALVIGSFELKTNTWTLAQYAARLKALYKSL